MNNLPRQRLHELIHQYGHSLCDEPTRAKGLLSDFCGYYRKEISVLMIALQEGIPDKLLLSSQNSIPQAVALTRLSKMLHENRGLDEEAARWAVESWALALDLVSQSELDNLSSTPTLGRDSSQAKKDTLLVDNPSGSRPPPVPTIYRQEVISPLSDSPKHIQKPNKKDTLSKTSPLSTNATVIENNVIDEESPLDQKRLDLRKEMMNSIGYFYWISGFSLLNSIISLTGASQNPIHSFITHSSGLGITQWVDMVLLKFAQESDGASVIGIGFALNLCIAGFFLCMGILGRKLQGWAVTLGIIIYLLDTFLFIADGNWVGVAVHAFVLLALLSGLQNMNDLIALEKSGQ
jgi:hypothetical protein